MSKSKQHKIKRIKKFHLWPTILINTIATAFLIIIILYFMYSYITNILQSKISTSTEVMNKYSDIVETFFTEGSDCAHKYARLVEANCDLNDRTSIKKQLVLLKETGDFSNIGVAFLDGSVESAEDTITDVSNETFFKETLDGKSGIYFLDTFDNESILFTAPLYKGQEIYAVLYLSNSRNLTSKKSEASLWDYPDAYYILNQKNEVVAYVGTPPEDFNYQTILEKGVISKTENPLDVRHFFNSSFRDNMILEGNIENTLEDEGSEFSDDSYISMDIWYETKLTGNLDTYKTFAFRKETLDSISLTDLLLSFVLAGILMVGPMFFMLVYTIMQLVTNYRLSRLLYFDPATGGNNFLHFKLVSEKLLKKRKNQNHEFAFVSFDVNKFRVFNEIHGHEQGDELLEKIYLYLKKNLRKQEPFARYAADQFSVILSIDTQASALARVEQILKELSNIYPNENLMYSAGIYTVLDKKMSIERMNNFAIFAKDTLKDNQTCNISTFDSKMRDELVKEHELEELMQKALDRHEFAVYLQPKYNVTDQTLSGAEALVRWISPEKGFISPGDFIPIFERNGFILKLDDYMLKEVALLQRRWLDEKKTLVPISVNISRAHFTDNNLAMHICEVVDQYKVPHELIELELTESAFFDDKKSLINTVNQLREFGFRVSMDDFGSGYSSLNSLKDLPLDIIKLDGEFFRNSNIMSNAEHSSDVEHNSAGENVSRSENFSRSENVSRSETVITDTIQLAKHLDMVIVAEGIETKEQVAFLERIGCDMIQGFYFAKPMPIADYETLNFEKK